MTGKTGCWWRFTRRNSVGDSRGIQSRHEPSRRGFSGYEICATTICCVERSLSVIAEKMKIRVCALAAAVFLATNATAGPPPGSSNRAAIKQARLAQNSAIARHDLDSIASYWTDDVTICRGLGFQLAGKAAYRKLFEQDDQASKDVIVYERIPTGIETSSAWPLAFETGVWKGHVGNAHGPVAIQGRYSAQWVKRDARWLIRSEVFGALAGFGQGLESKSAP
jgi:ketosteroid isomerase-like protein